MSLQHWESYYRAGALASCPLGPDGGYTQELRDAWAGFFSKLPAGARILDVGTGNGAVALIARETSASFARSFEIHGIDLARIDPARDVHDGMRLFDGISFHAEVASERLPFDAGSFDAVSGQYALEYTAVEQSLREIRRVLKPGGRAQFIIHHADSIVARKARESLRQSSLVLEETRIFRKLRRHLKSAQQSRSVARRTLSDLTEAMDKLGKAALAADDALTINVTIDAVGKLLASRLRISPAALDLEVDRVEGSIRASVHRLQDLVRSGQSEGGMQGILKLARTDGFEIDELALQYHAVDKLVGWRLRLTRP
jgi:ubiquinone/menaquinone biosynthesis C-methylase UbiE